MKRGQGTMPLEEFVKLAMRVFLAGIILTIIASIYLWWASPDLKSDATAKNELENLVNLINAQEGEEWETKTIIVFPEFSQAIIGFADGQPRYEYLEGPFNKISVDRPGSCSGPCLCVYETSLKDESPSPIECKNVEHDIEEGIDIRNYAGTTCNLWKISKEGVVSFELLDQCGKIAQESDLPNDAGSIGTTPGFG